MGTGGGYGGPQRLEAQLTGRLAVADGRQRRLPLLLLLSLLLHRMRLWRRHLHGRRGRRRRGGGDEVAVVTPVGAGLRHDADDGAGRVPREAPGPAGGRHAVGQADVRHVEVLRRELGRQRVQGGGVGRQTRAAARHVHGHGLAQLHGQGGHGLVRSQLRVHVLLLVLSRMLLLLLLGMWLLLLLLLLLS